MAKNAYRRDNDENLPEARDFWGSKRLNKVFRNKKNLDPIRLLLKLNTEFGIGAPIPTIDIRSAKPGLAAMIVVQNTWDDAIKSIHVSAEGLTKAKARLHPLAVAALRDQAKETALRFQARLAPTTVRYSTIFSWWLAKRAKEKESLKQTDEKKRQRRNGDFDPKDSDDRDGPMVAVLLEFTEDRTMLSHTKNIGNEFKVWFRERKKEEGALVIEETVKGAMDATVGKYQSVLSQSVKEFADEYRLPVKTGFEKTRGKVDYEQRLATGITWTGLVTVVFFCLGYLWNGDGFAWEWEERNGKPYQRLSRLSGKALAVHLAMFLPVIRLILIYATTGTRLNRIGLLGWDPDDRRGWIDFERRMIIRNGRLSPNPTSKPRRPSRLLRPVLHMLAHFFREDEARRRAEVWDDVEGGGFYVVHDGRGNRVKNLGYRAKEAFAAVGIDNRRHDLKASCVGFIWEAGFELNRVARLTGNDLVVVNQHYLFLEANSDGVARPKPVESKLRFLQLMDPQKLCRRVPRTSQPGPPPAPPKKRRLRGTR